MIEIFFGILVGLLFRPILWQICVLLLRSKLGSPHKSAQYIPERGLVTKTQVRMCRDSLHQCNDLDWFNILLQRYLTLAKESYAFTEKIKNVILKKAEPFLQYRLIRKMDILDISVGREFPIIKNITILTEEEFNDILLSQNVGEEAESNYNVGSELRSKLFTDLRGLNICRSTEDPVLDDRKIEKEIYKKVFRNCLLLADISFLGETKIRLTVEMPGSIKYELVITLEKFQGKSLLRMPSKAHQTRFEITFMNNPNFEISITLLYSEDSLKSFSVKYFKKMFLYGLTNAVMYPSWNSFYLPLLCPSLRKIEHSVEKINVKNYRKVLQSAKEEILLYTSLDYKIIKKSLKYIKRRTQCSVNEKGRIFRYEFSIPEDGGNTCEDKHEKEFESDASGILSHFYDWSIFKGIFSGFVSLKVIKKFDSAISLVLLYFSDEAYQFTRIKGDRYVIFQSNDPSFPEFMLFETRNNIFYIYQYGLRKNLVISDNRLAGIVRKVDGGRSKTLGFEKLHNILSFSFGKASEYFKTPVIYPEIDMGSKIELPSDEVYSIFIEYKSLMAKRPERFCTKKMDMSVSRDELVKMLLDDVFRFQLLGHNLSIIGQSKLDESIYTSILCEAGDDNNDMIIHTFFNESCIIDVETGSKSLLQGFKIKECEDEKTELKVFSEHEFPQMNFLNFLNYLNLLMRHGEIQKIAEKKPKEEILWKESFEKAILCHKGSVYIEASVGAVSSVLFSASRNIKQNYILKKFALCPNSTGKFVFSAEENDRVLVMLKTKHKTNQKVFFRAAQLPDKFYRDEFVSCEVMLGSKKSAAVPIFGHSSSFLFWKIPMNAHICMDLKSSEESFRLSNSRIIPAKPIKQTFTFTNIEKEPTSFDIYLGMTSLT